MSEEEARGDDQADQLVSERPSVEVGKGEVGLEGRWCRGVVRGLYTLP